MKTRLFSTKELILGLIGLLGMIISIIVFKTPQLLYTKELKANEVLYINRNIINGVIGYQVSQVGYCKARYNTEEDKVTRVILNAYKDHFEVKTIDCLNNVKVDFFYSGTAAFRIYEGEN